MFSFIQVSLRKQAKEAQHNATQQHKLISSGRASAAPSLSSLAFLLIFYFLSSWQSSPYAFFSLSLFLLLYLETRIISVCVLSVWWVVACCSKHSSKPPLTSSSSNSSLQDISCNSYLQSNKQHSSSSSLRCFPLSVQGSRQS